MREWMGEIESWKNRVIGSAGNRVSGTPLSTCFRLLLSAFTGPAFFHGLAGAAQGQSVCGNILSDRGACGHVRSFADAHRRNQSGIAANESTVFDNGYVLVDSIVIAGDCPGANVDAIADFGITQIGEMVGLGAAPQSGLLGLHEIPDMRALANFAFRAQMRIRTENRMRGDLGLVNDATWPDQHAVCDLRVADDAIRANAAARTYAGIA